LSARPSAYARRVPRCWSGFQPFGGKPYEKPRSVSVPSRAPASERVQAPCAIKVDDPLQVLLTPILVAPVPLAKIPVARMSLTWSISHVLPPCRPSSGISPVAMNNGSRAPSLTRRTAWRPVRCDRWPRRRRGISPRRRPRPRPLGSEPCDREFTAR